MKEKEMEMMKLKEEGNALQQHSALLGQQLEEARLELEVLVVLLGALFYTGSLGVDCILCHDKVSHRSSYFADSKGEFCGDKEDGT